MILFHVKPIFIIQSFNHPIIQSCNHPIFGGGILPQSSQSSSAQLTDLSRLPHLGLIGQGSWLQFSPTRPGDGSGWLKTEGCPEMLVPCLQEIWYADVFNKDDYWKIESFNIAAIIVIVFGRVCSEWVLSLDASFNKSLSKPWEKKTRETIISLFEWQGLWTDSQGTGYHLAIRRHG